MLKSPHPQGACFKGGGSKNVFSKILLQKYAVFCVLLKKNEVYIENTLVKKNSKFPTIYTSKLLQKRKAAIYVPFFLILFFAYEPKSSLFDNQRYRRTIWHSYSLDKNYFYIQYFRFHLHVFILSRSYAKLEVNEIFTGYKNSGLEANSVVWD